MSKDNTVDELDIESMFVTTYHMGRDGVSYPDALVDIDVKKLNAHYLKEFLESIGEDEPIPKDILKWEDGDQRKYWQNKLKAELRQKLERKYNG